MSLAFSNSSRNRSSLSRSASRVQDCSSGFGRIKGVSDIGARFSGFNNCASGRLPLRSENTAIVTGQVYSIPAVPPHAADEKPPHGTNRGDDGYGVGTIDRGGWRNGGPGAAGGPDVGRRHGDGNDDRQDGAG